MGVFSFGDEGPLFQDVRAGDTVTVEAVIPDRYDAQFVVTDSSGSSGAVHLAGSVHKSRHKGEG